MPSGSTGRVSAYAVWWICVELAWWCCARLRRVRTLERSVWTSSCTGTRNRVLWRFLWWSGVVISLAAVLLHSPDACCLSFCPAPGTCLWCEHLVRSAIRRSRGDPCRRLMATLGKRGCLYSLFADAIVNTTMFQCQTAVMSPTEYTRYKVMVQMVNVLVWPTYCITRCKDEQCRTLWRHWPSSAGVQPIFRNRTISWRHWPNCAGGRPSFGITPYHDVTDRVTRCPTDFWHHAIPWRHTVTSLTELCRCPTHFLKTIHFLKSQYTDRVALVSHPTYLVLCQWWPLDSLSGNLSDWSNLVKAFLIGRCRVCSTTSAIKG